MVFIGQGIKVLLEELVLDSDYIRCVVLVEGEVMRGGLQGELVRSHTSLCRRWRGWRVTAGAGTLRIGLA